MPTTYRNLLRLSRTETDRLLEMAPRKFRPYADANRPFRDMPVPEDSHLAFLDAFFPHAGATESERLAASAAMFSVLAALPANGFHRTGYERLLLEISHWPPDSVRALAQVHSAIRSAAVTPAQATDWMAWFLRRQFQGRNVWDQGLRIPDDLYLDALRRNHPDFHAASDGRRLYNAREAYESALRFERANYRIHGFTPTIDPFQFGRDLEEGFKRWLTANNRMIADLDLTPGYPKSFPEVDLVFRDGTDICIAQVTHGDLPTLRDKYLRLIAELDVEPFKETDLYNSTIQLLVSLAHLPAGTNARVELLKRVRLLVPEDSVEGLRLLIASHDRFGDWTGSILTREQKLALIQPIGREVIEHV